MLLFTGFVLTAAIIAMSPTPILPENKLSIIKGTIDHIYASENADIVIRLKENKKSYYIHQGIRQGISPDELSSLLLHEKVTIKYPEYWSFWIKSETTYLSKLIKADEVIYSSLASDLVARN